MNNTNIKEFRPLIKPNVLLDMLPTNEDVRDCFEKIIAACRELKLKTGCPNDDVDRFLEYAIGKWAG